MTEKEFLEKAKKCVEETGYDWMMPISTDEMVDSFLYFIEGDLYICYRKTKYTIDDILDVKYGFGDEDLGEQDYLRFIFKNDEHLKIILGDSMEFMYYYIGEEKKIALGYANETVPDQMLAVRNKISYRELLEELLNEEQIEYGTNEEDDFCLFYEDENPVWLRVNDENGAAICWSFLQEGIDQSARTNELEKINKLNCSSAFTKYYIDDDGEVVERYNMVLSKDKEGMRADLYIIIVAFDKM